jgi:amino acid permease
MYDEPEPNVICIRPSIRHNNSTAGTRLEYQKRTRDNIASNIAITMSFSANRTSAVLFTLVTALALLSTCDGLRWEWKPRAHVPSTMKAERVPSPVDGCHLLSTGTIAGTDASGECATTTSKETSTSVLSTRGGGGDKIKAKEGSNKKKKKNIKGGTASIPASVFNLVNNVAGAGILTLSAGMAAGTGWIPAVVICAMLGVISSHTFCLVGRACEMMDEPDFKGLWARTIGPKSTYLVDSIIAIMCLAGAVIYSGILGDVFTPLLESAGLPEKLNGRTSNIIIVTVAALLPMSLIKNLSALAFTSVLGFSAIMYTVIFVIIRALDGTYTLGSGKFVMDGAILAPSFAKSSQYKCGFASLVLASNLSLAYVAHYNAPAYYRELKDTTSDKFSGMVRIGFVLLTIIYIVTMCSGYSTFGDVTQGNILLSYHPADFLSTLGRLATGLSILFGFPLVAAGAREGLSGFFDGIGFPDVKADKNHFLFVVSILAFVTLISTTVKDVSLVVGLTGAVMGSLIVYIIPVVVYVKAVGVVKGLNSQEYTQAKWKNLGLVPFGCAAGALGVFMTVKGAMA